MKMTLTISVQGINKYTAACDLSDLQQMAFEPMRTTDDRVVGFFSGEVECNSLDVKRVIKTREDAAEILAREMTALIVNSMKKNDTHNGYKAVK